MIDLIARFVGNLVGRITGPMTFRLVLQPAMAIIAGIKAGIEDARMDKPAYMWAIAHDPAHRRELLRDGWKDVTKVFIAAAGVDLIYQWVALRWIYPGEALAVAFILAALPYILIRAATNRLARLWMRRAERA